MTFYERYENAIAPTGLDPCSQSAANIIGVTKAALSTWKVRGTTPMGDTIARAADRLHVSADYLLGRTDDMTDYCAPDAPACQSAKTTAKTVPFSKAENSTDNILLQLYERLDSADRLKAQGVLQGMLMQDKYTMLDAAHVRTDAPITDDMIAHDEDIMDNENF